MLSYFVARESNHILLLVVFVISMRKLYFECGAKKLRSSYFPQCLLFNTSKVTCVALRFGVLLKKLFSVRVRALAGDVAKLRFQLEVFYNRQRKGQ